MYAVRLDHADIGWRDDNKDFILNDISGQFEQGSMTAVLGPNGAGKSTLIKVISQFIKPTRGTVEIAPELQKQLSLLPQLNDIDRSFPISVYDLVAMGAWRRLGVWRGYNRTERERIQQALEQVGMLDKAQQLIGTLSGGQLQRGLFARLIVRNAQVLLLDEPLAAIDEATSEDLLQIMQRWQAEGRTVITVLHNLNLAKKYFPDSLLLAQQVVAWGPTEQVLQEENLAKARRLALQGF